MCCLLHYHPPVSVSGMYMGTVIAMPLAGILAEYVNWEAIFYVFGEYLTSPLHSLTFSVQD